MPNPTTAEPTEQPTDSPVGVPVVPDSVVQVCSGETTLIFVLLDAEPGLPLPNALAVSRIVVEGVVRRELAVDALSLIAQEDGKEKRDGGVVSEEDRDIDGARCEVGPVDAQTIQYVGGAYTGAYRCTFEVEDERGIVTLADLFLQVDDCTPKVPDEMPKPPPPAPEPEPAPKPAPKPAWQPAWKPSWEAPPQARPPPDVAHHPSK